jgi:hypothetical protein
MVIELIPMNLLSLQNSRLTAAITAPHLSALPIARLISGHSERSVREKWEA